MIFKVLANEASGCLTYLLGCQQAGLAAVVDPARTDVDRYVEMAAGLGLEIAHVLDTHIHADHVSGNRALAERAGVRPALHEAADVRFPFAPLADGRRLALGSVDLAVLHTPGHTPESMCLVVTDRARAPEPWFVLTGDTLFVGDVGRPDFGGEAAAATLHRSLVERLLPLGDSVEVYPAHGAGSLCGRAMSSKPGSTIGFERRFNLALRHADTGAFVRALLEGLPPRPPLMDGIIAKNRGIAMTERPTPARLAPRDLPARLGAGAVLVDVRDPRAFGAAHVAGSLNVPADSPQFAERVGWFVPPGRAVVLLAGTEADAAGALAGLARVGLDEVAGVLVGGEPEVRATGLPVRDLPNLTAPELARRLAAEPALAVLDVREPVEWESGHIPGALHIPMREVAGRLAEVPRDRPLAVVCRGGQRSSLVASLLLARGFDRLVNTWGGMTGWRQAGLPLAED
jgi:glyoxylase-like metal-dependent hydrolase (beta-lactamase superfamily II)/rhodanese-related sulfurtransferase